MSIRPLIHLLTGMVFALGLTGCNYFASVGSSSGQVPQVGALPAAEGGAVNARLALSFRKKLNDEPVESPDPVAEAELQERAAEALKASGFFKEVGPDAADPALDIKIVVMDDGRYSPRQRMITALTLYLYPNKSTDRLIYTATVSDPAGKQLGAYQMEDTVTQWQQLFLAFGMPFAAAQKVGFKLHDRFNQNLVYRMHQDGLIK